MSKIRISQLKLIAILALIISVLFTSSAVLYSNFHDVSEHHKWVLHTSEVINELDQVLSGVKEAESGARGYLLTHRPEYLESYQQGLHDSEFNLQKFREATLDNRIQTDDADKAKAALKERSALLNSLIASVQKEKKNPDNNDPRLIRGENAMNQIRGLVDHMKTRENDLLSARTALAEKSRELFLMILTGVTGLMALVIIGSFIQIGRAQKRTLLDSERKELEARQKDALSNLGTIVAGDAPTEEMSTQILNFLIVRLGFLAGKVWLLEGGSLKPVAAVGTERTAYDKSKDYSLVKLAFERQEPWHVSNVPGAYWQITSGLGGAKPDSLSFIPLSFQSKKIGVIELASFQQTRDLDGMLSSVAETIGIGLNAAQSRSQLQMLLERTQQQSEELQAQQEELRTSNEELEQQARALESQQQSLNVKNRELEMAQAELEHRAKELERSSQYKSDFLAKMSHELRTPLNGLLILSTLLAENKEKNLTDQQRQFARSINSAGNDLLVLINDILDLSKIEARKLSLRAENFTLEDLFKSKRRTFDPQMNDKGLEFNVEIPEGLEKTELHTDRHRLEQILRNFLSNAIKFTEKGSVTLYAQVNEADQSIRFSVMDTGIGIPNEKRKSIFDAFEQADSSISRKYGGTGLGLTISRELAGLLGGEISVESEVGKGSTFSLEIPMRLPSAGEPVRQAESKTNGHSNGHLNGNDQAAFYANLTEAPAEIIEKSDRTQTAAKKALRDLPPDKKTILVVEDDPNFRASIVEAVKSYGFHAIEASDGELAVAILDVHTPDAILLDIKLPGISGLGILEMAKQMPHLRHVPVHMISGMEYQTNALRMGALGYLTKPVTIEKVRSALDRIENIVSRQVRRVLIIEDDERQNQAIAQLISGNDLEVVSAKTGKTAVAEITKKGFDCIILDLTLPDVSGFDLLSELRDLEISLPPIVIYTGRDLSDEEERYLRKYSESIVIKGARSPERLLDEVNLFLHRIESLLPEEKREMLSSLRSQEKTFEGKTVLLVDDDIRNIFALMSALEARGLHVRVARDGVEALESLHQHSDIDLVLMDIMMPRMDGFEAMRRIRDNSDPHMNAMPIVALTAKAMREDHEKCMEAGASDYLPKPVNLENLTTVLKVWLAPNGFL